MSKRVITPRSRVRNSATGCVGTVTEVCEGGDCWVLFDGDEEDEIVPLDLLEVLEDKA